MKKALLLVLFLITPVLAQAEVVEDFSANYHINQDGSVSVSETVVYDFGEAYRHGMYRTLTTNHAEPASVWYKDRQVRIEVVSITRDGNKEPYTSEGIGEIRLKIGDPDITITGSHVYNINYTLAGALSYIDDQTAELYWNVTGSNWEVPLLKVRATITGVEFGTSTCYITGQTCEVSVFGRARVEALGEGLGQGSELTMAVSIPGKQVDTMIYESVQSFLVLSIISLIALVVSVVASVRYRRYYHKKRSVVAEYEPYADVEPMFAGMLLDDRLDTRDIAAGLIYLAEQGFITIKKTDRKIIWLFNQSDYEITLKRPTAELPSRFLQSILQLIFTDMVVGEMVALSTIKNNNTRKLINAKRIAELTKSLKSDLVVKGFIEEKKFGTRFYTVGIFLVLGLFLGSLMMAWFGLVAYVSAVAIALAVMIYEISTHRRRTVKGYDAMFNLRGFKEFLSVTDKERFDFHNAPERNPEQFMKYLPYAIAFGVEEKWAEVFKDMEITSPEWYDSKSGSFAATSFVHDITAFTATVSASTQPASSGGGSAGGGGGGGGGSW